MSLDPAAAILAYILQRFFLLAPFAFAGAAFGYERAVIVGAPLRKAHRLDLLLIDAVLAEERR